MKSIKVIACMVIGAVFYIPMMIWAVVKFIRCKDLDCSMIDGLDRQHRINRAEYFKQRNVR